MKWYNILEVILLYTVEIIIALITLFEDNLDFIVSFSLVMIPLILSIDTLKSYKSYRKEYHKVRVEMLTRTIYVLLISIILFVLKYLRILVDNILYDFFSYISLILILILIKLIYKLFMYLLDEIERFKNFNEKK